MNLLQAFAQVADKTPEKTALYWGDQEFTYGGLREQTRQVTAQLQSAFDVKPGDRVALWLKNCPEFIPALFGIWQAGGVFVPVNNFLKTPEVLHILNDSGANVIITDASLAPALPELIGARPELRSMQVEDWAVNPSELKLPAAWPERAEPDLAVIIYTSGTTGRPKGAMLSHGNLLHNVASSRLALHFVETDRMAVVLPMFHCFMLCVGILLPLLNGAAIVLIRSLHPLRNLLHEIIRHQATVLPAIPQLYRNLVALPEAVALPSLRMCISGAAPLPVQTLTAFAARFPCPLIEGYGLSEASPEVTKNPLLGPRKAGSIGLPIPNVEVSIQDSHGRELGAGEIGELCVRGGNVMLGYWNQPAETAKVMRGQWLLTGDIGHRDADGYLFITDRKKDMLLVNGNNVYPREIEEVLYQFPGVMEAAVIGVPHQRKGEEPLAYVVAPAGMNLEEAALLKFLRSKLADHKMPRRIIFLPALPHTANGKILKTALREMARLTAAPPPKPGASPGGCG